jgi:hypothetical protein
MDPPVGHVPDTPSEVLGHLEDIIEFLKTLAAMGLD